MTFAAPCLVRLVALAAFSGSIAIAPPAAALQAAAPAAPELAPAPADPHRPRQAGSEVPAPKRKKLVLPEYPEEAKARGIRGIVLIDLVVERDGSVGETRVVRSIAELDDAALDAVRQWEYEITRVDGEAVRVRLAVPITFSMKVPELTRGEGVPELRQGALPAFPSDGGSGSTVEAELTVDPTGHVAEAIVTKGNSPWAEMLLRAVRTWIFNWEEHDTFLSFRLRAVFARGRSGDDSRVDLTASDARRLLAESPSPAPLATPAPASRPATVPAAAPAPEVAPQAATPHAAPAAAPTTVAAPASTPPASPPPATPPVDAPVAPVAAPSSKPAPPAPPIETIRVPRRPEPTPPGTTSAAPAPTPEPERPGYSSVRDVTLALGVPDLTQGRRPVVPPLARMGNLTGQVEVAFSVGVSGLTSVQGVNGPEALQAAAKGMVESWQFRRTTTERVYLRATIEYGADTAKANVVRAPAP